MNDPAEPDELMIQVFNTPMECGLRAVALLAEAFPHRADLQRLVNYDYLLVHSGDVVDGPPSIHPATPHRSGELLVRRPLIEQGIRLMMSKSIIECDFSTEGINYFAGEWSVPFLSRLSADYTTALKERAQWVVSHFSTHTNSELTLFMRSQWSSWGAEFEFESLVRTSDE
jgi:hypothetical protein